MITVKYAIMSDNKIIRCLQLSKVDQKAAAAKALHILGNLSCFCKVELISENLYKVYKEMGIKG